MLVVVLCVTLEAVTGVLTLEVCRSQPSVLYCLQLVDILHHVWVPDWACELYHQLNQGFVSLLLGSHGDHLYVPPQERESLAGHVGDTLNV